LKAIATEVQGRLEQSLHNAVWLTLGLERQDFRVQRPWSATMRQENQAVLLDAGTRVIEVFDQAGMNRQLLILGEPGAGKTTMMLELAEDLVGRSQRDKDQPIPVLVSLSSWKPLATKTGERSFFDWLVAEVKAKYGLRSDLGKKWLGKGMVLPLLDGLDEVAPQYQRDCAIAINRWLTGDVEQRPCGVLVCCRREEFEQVVREPLSLYGAIYLQALTVGQVEEYFERFGLGDVGQSVRQDEALLELLTKPLFLSMFGLVQMQGAFSLDDWGERSTSESKVEYLLDTYWNAAMNRRLIVDPEDGRSSKTYGMKAVPSQKQVRRSLVFLAKMLDREEDGTELLIEKMQPTGLITKRQKWIYRLIVGLIIGLIAGLIFSLFFGLIAGLIFGLFFGLIIGLIGGLIEDLIGSLIFFGLDTISPVEAIEISMLSFDLREIIKSLRNNLIVSLIASLMSGLSFGLITGLIFGLIIGLIFGLVRGLIGGPKLDIQTRVKPNQGIKNSVRNTVVMSAIALSSALPFRLFLEHLLAEMVDPEIIPGIVALSLSCLIWYSFQEGGGQALCQHLALRIVLAANRYAPFRYDRLLNYCTERLLLQRIGGRYRFMHKTLQDYFAKMELEEYRACE
jgi:GTPase SAR1 family protein